MKTNRTNRLLVRHWVPRFRKSTDKTLRQYERYAKHIYSVRESYIIERVCRSELRRRENHGSA